MKTYAANFAAVFALLLGALSGPAQTVVSDCTGQALQDALDLGGIITFSNDCSITLTQTLRVNQPETFLSAAGHNVSISGGGKVRILEALNNFRMVGLTLANGRVTNDGGGALYVHPNVSVVLQNCYFVSNTSAGPAGFTGSAGSTNLDGGDGQNGGTGNPGWGGAIWNKGSLTLASCTLSNNTSVGGNGGSGGAGGVGTSSLGKGGNGGAGGSGGTATGGAIHNGGDLTLFDCTIAGNSTVSGNGGAAGAGGSAPFPGLPGNGGAAPAASGGGIYNNANISVERCTIVGNTSTGGNSATAGTSSSGVGRNGSPGGDGVGGGFCNAWWGSFVNSTFYGNASRGGAGGTGGSGSGTLPVVGNGGNGGNGVGGGVQNSGTLTLQNCTLASSGVYGGTNGLAGSDSAGSSGSVGQFRGGDIATVGGACTLENSLIITPQAGSCGYGTFNDGGYNMTSDSSIALGGSSFPNTSNPRAGAFGNNGGSTFTLALLTNSPAIDKIPDGVAVPSTDQRGIPRPMGPASDIGAYESDMSSAPFILTEPQDRTVTQGSSVTFSVSAFGAAPLSYQWLLDGNVITNARASSYTVTSAQTNNLGPYSVVITNRLGSTNSSEAFIHLSPGVSSATSNQVVTAGSDLTLMVAATGEPPLSFQWMLNGTNLIGATASSLQLTNIQVPNIGTYSVVISNSVSTLTQVVASVNIRPTILTQPASQTVLAGTPASFTVSATGSPTLVYQWLHNGEALAGATFNSYTNSSVQLSNIGLYSVVITNLYGTTNSLGVNLSVMFPLSGVVTEGTNAGAPGIPGVLLTFGSNTLVTSSSGTYATNLPAGDYNPVSASLSNYTFTTVGPPLTNATLHLFGPTELDFVGMPLVGVRITTNGTVSISGGAVLTNTYVIEGSTNLYNWSPVATNIGPVQFSIPSASNTPPSFYRLKR